MAGGLAAIAALAAAAPAPAQEVRFPVVEAALDNGLRILVAEDHTVPAITYDTFFRVGSRDERPGRTGISHLFEHMMFNGSARFGPGEFDRRLESRGGTSNAFTSEDVTGYTESFPSGALETVIEMEADRMAALALTEESLKTEREVVKEERRLRIDEDVPGSMLELLNATAYLAHPYGWPVGGWPADLDAITVKDCQDYFRAHYAPDNAVVIVAGDVEPARVIALVRKAYAAIPAQPAPAAVVADEPAQRGERRAILRRPAQNPSVALAFHVPGTRDPDDVLVLDLAETILGGGEAARLVRLLVRDRALASSVSVSNAYRVDPSLFFVQAEARPGVAVDALEEAIVGELDRLARDEVPAAELQKARNQRTMTFLRGLKTAAGRAEQLGLAEIYFGSYQRLFDTPRRYQAVQAAAVRAAAARAFRADNRSVVVLVPEAPAVPADGSAP